CGFPGRWKTLVTRVLRSLLVHRVASYLSQRFERQSDRADVRGKLNVQIRVVAQGPVNRIEGYDHARMPAVDASFKSAVETDLVLINRHLEDDIRSAKLVELVL